MRSQGLVPTEIGPSQSQWDLGIGGSSGRLAPCSLRQTGWERTHAPRPRPTRYFETLSNCGNCIYCRQDKASVFFSTVPKFMHCSGHHINQDNLAKPSLFVQVCKFPRHGRLHAPLCWYTPLYTQKEVQVPVPVPVPVHLYLLSRSCCISQ
jgi:hypothetical protein